MRTRTLRRSAQAWWLLLQRDAAGRIWLQRRPGAGIWVGLYCPPVWDSREALLAALGLEEDSAAVQAKWVLLNCQALGRMAVLVARRVRRLRD